VSESLFSFSAPLACVSLTHTHPLSLSIILFFSPLGAIRRFVYFFRVKKVPQASFRQKPLALITQKKFNFTLPPLQPSLYHSVPNEIVVLYTHTHTKCAPYNITRTRILLFAPRAAYAADGVARPATFTTILSTPRSLIYARN